MIDIADTATDDFGNDIVLRQMKSSAAGAENILLIGRFHGDEPEGEFILEKMTEELQDEKHHLIIFLSLPVLTRAVNKNLPVPTATESTSTVTIPPPILPLPALTRIPEIYLPERRPRKKKRRRLSAGRKLIVRYGFYPFIPICIWLTMTARHKNLPPEWLQTAVTGWLKMSVTRLTDLSAPGQESNDRFL